jgi:aryl carrier-like protein
VLPHLDEDAAAVAKLCDDLGDRLTVVPDLAALPAAEVTAVLHVGRATDERSPAGITPDRLDAELAEAALAGRLDVLFPDALLVLISPAATMLGVPGFGNCAPAGAVLDALAARRRTEGRPTVRLAVAAGAGGAGLDALPSSWLRTLVSRAADLDGSALLVADIDWTRPGLTRSLLRAVSTAARATAPDIVDSALLSRIADAAEDQRLGLLTELVRTQVAAVLGHHDAAGVEPDDDFVSLGLSSFTALELSGRLRGVGLRLPPVAVFDHPTSAALARHIHERFADIAGAPHDSPDQPRIPTGRTGATS